MLKMISFTCLQAVTDLLLRPTAPPAQTCTAHIFCRLMACPCDKLIRILCSDSRWNILQARELESPPVCGGQAPPVRICRALPLRPISPCSDLPDVSYLISACPLACPRRLFLSANGSFEMTGMCMTDLLSCHAMGLISFIRPIGNRVNTAIAAGTQTWHPPPTVRQADCMPDKRAAR